MKVLTVFNFCFQPSRAAILIDDYISKVINKNEYVFLDLQKSC